MFQTFYRRFYQNTTNHVMGSRADHDKSRYEAYSVTNIPRKKGVHVLIFANLFYVSNVYVSNAFLNKHNVLHVLHVPLTVIQ